MNRVAWRLLALLHFLVAVNAVGGGIYGLSGAPAVPLAWLKGTPFHSYFFPSLILLVLVGGSCAWAGTELWRQTPRARHASLIAGGVLAAWITIQVALIGYVSWLQPAMGVAAVLMLVVTPQPNLRRNDNSGK